MMTALWHWQDDVELTAFSDGFGGVIVLRWIHSGEFVRKDELIRGDHVVFDGAGYVLTIHRRRQHKIGDPKKIALIKSERMPPADVFLEWHA